MKTDKDTLLTDELNVEYPELPGTDLLVLFCLGGKKVRFLDEDTGASIETDSMVYLGDMR
jgi:hypothetical protein